jgi:hypothetical protein
MRPLGDHALALADRGLFVFPCQPSSKTPATAHGHLDSTRDFDIIGEWWRQNPDYNIAVATGRRSGFFAPDIDGPDAEAALRKLETEHGALPPTIEAITARGRHIYLKATVPIGNSVGKLAPGIDVRGDGGYVLVPPSVHPSGRRYCWSVDSADGLADPPQWLIDKIVADKSTPNGRHPRVPAVEWRRLAREGAAEGARNDTLTKLCGHLLSLPYIDAGLVLELLLSWNQTRCRPPLSDAEVATVFDSILSRELKKWGGRCR